jgi:5-oxoprolinase (ATP-hydrolysing)
MTVNEPADGDFARAFVEEHRQRYGYVHAHRPLELISARVEAVGGAAESLPISRREAPCAIQPRAFAPAWFDGREYTVAVLRRDELRPGHAFEGPAIVLEPTSTTVVDPGWRAEVMSGGELFVEWTSMTTGTVDGTRSVPATLEVDPVALEIFHNHFAAIAEQMGITLRNTSSSVNVKERLDFSCALFTAAGDLVVNAPHIPVHLGAMGETVKRIISDNPMLRPGDVYVTNDPYRGGSHLPDVTVITPVFQSEAESPRPMFFTASRAHHAEIGGTTPGSMPPFSRSLAEEGVLIRNFKLVDAGRSRNDELRELLATAPYPSRNVDDNLYDISAQVAANQQGKRDLLSLVDRYGWSTVAAYMEHIQSAAEQKMRKALTDLSSGRRIFADRLDDGSTIAVAVDIQDGSARCDFTGTSPVLAGNLNANRAIVTAALMYCLRCLIAEDIPLNQGVLAPVSIVLPECLLNPPERGSPEECAAVAGGNVETSQRVVDVVLGALGLAGASQGTMNNLLFGDHTFGYYETICGGAGATPQGPGADAIHTHMTNTRLTDPEVLEYRYPVRLREFRVRRGSGGKGWHRGGDGVVRHIEFLRAVNLSLISQRRGPYPPYGAAGGEPGAFGHNRLLRADGTSEELPGVAGCQVEPGDVLVIETPGGGGWGAPAPDR